MPDLAALPRALLELAAGAVLYVDNDPMLRALARTPPSSVAAWRAIADWPYRCFVLSTRKLRQNAPGGVMAVGQVVEAPQVREMTRRLAKTSGARGAFCTEFKLDAQDGRYYFIEWNPRPAYFQSIGWRAGFDLAWLAYCDHADPPRLAAIEPAFSGDHYWINVAAHLRNLSKGPRRTAAAWRPYLGLVEWALFALDDLAP